MINHQSIAGAAGVSLQALNELLAGTVSQAVAARLGVTINDAQSFIQGTTTAAMAASLGIGTIAAGNELAHDLGAAGAIGLLFGRLLTQ
jgi:hypothetical protein